MKILYDHQAFTMEKFGGIPKYFCELMKNIPPEHQFNLSVILSYNQYLKENHRFFKNMIYPWPEREFAGKSFLKKRINFLNRQYSKYAINRGDYDLFHPTFYNDYFMQLLKNPFIITVHDLIIFKFKDTIYDYTLRRKMEEKVIRKASRIIAISRNTKKDIVEVLKINPDKIDVVYHGFNKPEVKEKVNLYGRYILYVGKRSEYKNFLTFAGAVSSLMKKEEDLNLICVGSPFEKDEIVELKKLQIYAKTIALRADEKTLNNLYSNAIVFAFPSLYEGFGMPILEAFANNCPTCISNTSCFPEIAGDAAAYFDPYSQDSICEAIKKVFYDDNYRLQMINSGKKRLENFSWVKTGEETVNSYEKAISAS